MVLKKLGSQTSVDDRYIRLSDAGIRGYKKIPAASCISYKSVRPELSLLLLGFLSLRLFILGAGLYFAFCLGG